MKGRNQVSKEYQDAVSDDMVLERIEVLVKAFERMKTIITGDLSNHDLRINLAVLSNLVYSYFYDVRRAKEFHGMQRINKPKKAAFLMKWLVIEKPISFDEDGFRDHDTLALLSCVNEVFAFRVALGYANIPLSRVPIDLQEDVIYSLIYRGADETALSLWFRTFMTLHGIDLE